jgi:hypothetical protein
MKSAYQHQSILGSQHTTVSDQEIKDLYGEDLEVVKMSTMRGKFLHRLLVSKSADYDTMRNFQIKEISIEVKEPELLMKKDKCIPKDWETHL